MAKITQAEVEQWIAANGGASALQYSVEQKSVKNPAYDPYAEPPVPQYITIPVETWKNSKTGAVLSAQRTADGDFDLYESASPDPNKPGADTDTPTNRNAAELQAQRERNAALPPDQDPAYETDAERRTRAQATIDRQGRDAKAAEDKARQDTLDQERKDKEAKAEAERNKPKPQQAPDGSWGYFDTSSTPPTWVPIASAPGAAPMKPVEVNGQWGVWQPGEAGKPPTFVRVDVPQAGAGIKNVDAWTPDFTAPDLGLGAWANAQRQKIGLPGEQGGITQKEYDAAISEAHGRAGTTITNITNANTVIRQRAADEEGIRNTRSGEAASDFNNALGVFNQVWKFADPKTGSIRNLIPGLMAEQKRYRDERTKEAPTLPGLHPLFQVASAQSAATAQPPAAREQAAGAGPAPAPYVPPGQPDESAAEAEAFRQQAQATTGATQQAIAPLVAQPPPAPVAAPAMAAPPPSQGPITDPRDAGVVPPPMTPPVNPAAGQPGNDPTQPVGMGQGPLTAFANQAMGGQQAPQPWDSVTPMIDEGALARASQPYTGPKIDPAMYGHTPDNPMIPPGQRTPGPMDGLMQQAQPGMSFDPFLEAGKLVQLGVPVEVATQALMQAGLMPRRMTQGAA